MSNVDLEKQLTELPDEVAKALAIWRKAELDREHEEAKLFLQFKGQEGKRTADEIKSMVRQSQASYDARLKETMAEVEYNRLNNRLMAAKKLASLRTAY